MKTLKLLPVAFIMLFVTACSSIQVTSDYDKDVNFNNLKTYAFFKEGIDHVELNDIDKKRILNAIDQTLAEKGLQKTDANPDFLINIFTKAQKRVDITNNNNFYSPWGYYGWGPYWGPSYTTVTTSTEGTLYIDVLDTKKKALVWQGIGSGVLGKNYNTEKKEAKVKEFAQKILENFPPVKGK